MSPIALAYISEDQYEQFLTPNLAREWSFEIQRVDPSRSVDHLADQLNQTGSPVVMTCWGTPYLPLQIQQWAPGLRYVCHLCGEVRPRLDLGLIDAGIMVTNWGHSISRTVAEHALLLTLGCLRQTTAIELAIHTEGGWQPHGITPPASLFEQRVGIFGFGAIARELLQLLQPFQCEIQAYSQGVPSELFAEHGVTEASSLEALFDNNHVVICVESLTENTLGIIDEPMLRRLEPGGVFVNVGRGRIVDEAALGRVARDGRITIGADVFHQEPLPADSPLRGLPNALLTPHMAGPTDDHRRVAGRFALQNIQSFFANQPLRAQLNRQRLAQMT